MKDKVYLRKEPDKSGIGSCPVCYYGKQKACGNKVEDAECIKNNFYFKQVFPKRVKIVKNDKKHHACSICCFASDNKNCCKYEMKYKCGINSIHFELINE